MFPNQELSALAAQKTRLQHRSAVHRLECRLAAVELARPVAWIDEARAKWKRLSPLIKIAGLAAGAAASRSVGGGRLDGLRRWIRWGTVAIGMVRGLRAAGPHRRAGAE